MTTTIYTILEEFREAARSKRDLGDKFERLIANYLMTDPQYADRLSQVWLWHEWPHRSGVDVGIDLVAEEHGTGDYWAIQCKFYDPDHSLQKADIDSFFTASGKRFATLDGERGFTNRLIVSTTDKWSKHAEEALADQAIPVTRLRVQDLADSPIDWAQFSLSRVDQIRLKPKKEPRPHQTEAITKATEAFETVDRGKLIMACGTGKTFTSLRLAERVTPGNARILFLAPSISLVAQTLREWTAEALAPIHAFVVCSDTKVGRDEEDLRTHDLAYPATTDAHKIALHAGKLSTDRRTVVFSTYQSIQVVADAQKQGLGEFDLIVCDEAHRTTGLTLPGEDPSDFSKVHHNHIVKARKRLYMTATPRIYADKSKDKAEETSAALYSMDDPEIYGPEFYRLGFGKAVDKDLLSEYKVLIVAVEEDKMAALANLYNFDGEKAIDTRFATKIIGSWKGLSKRGLMLVDDDGQQEAATEDPAPMRRAVAFSRSIKDSKQTTDVFGKLVDLYLEKHVDDGGAGMVGCHLDHVDGTMNALKRQGALEWLKANPGEGQCRILSNARCLSEGIDVPALDAVVFFDTRESIVDIVQSVGRVMRKAEGKRYGYIILPVGIPSSKVKDYNSYIDSDPQFKGIWKVIKALRAHDESLVDEAEFRRKIKVITDPARKGKKGGTGGGEGDEHSPVQTAIDFDDLPIDHINEAVYAAIPKKLGDREYWSEWAKSVAQIAERLMLRIREMLTDPAARTAFDGFLKGLRDNLNPAVGEDEAVEMLAQHVITRPVFEALFEGYSFTANNPVSKAMQAVVEVLDAGQVNSETGELAKFYDNLRERVSLAKSDKSRQEIIRNLYETFFKTAFKDMSDRLGIVYTPVQVVDFIIHSAEAALRKHFNTGLTDKGVQVLDPFTGTGTFMVRLLQSGLIKPEDLARKYKGELHANEIVLLAYYIAAINIESTYHGLAGEYVPFDGIVLTDTFQMAEKQESLAGFSVENSERVNRQKNQDIRVIVGNPPYSAQQDSQNDNNQNLAYPTLDTRIRTSYAALSSNKNPKNLYDSYIRALRWSSDRIGSRGIVAFVTNGSFVDSSNMDGLRKCLPREFTHLYIFNLRGFIRGKSKELSKLEGGNVFDILTGVAITVLVKDPAHVGACVLNYHDIGDSLSRVEKLEAIERLTSIAGIDWQRLYPNESGDWINQRDPAFENFMQLGDKESQSPKAIFGTYSLGVGTNRDPWTHNMGRNALSVNMAKMLDAYEVERLNYEKLKAGKARDHLPNVDEVINLDPHRIGWTRALKDDVRRGNKIAFEPDSIRRAMYRPFTKQWLYFNRDCNEYVFLTPKLFPTDAHKNVVISCIGVAERKGFSVLVTDLIPNLHFLDSGQCFPLYWYEKPDESAKPQGEMFGAAGTPDADGYIRRDAITDWALEQFRTHYQDDAIGKEDLFWYVYGILHSPEYKQRFAANLKKMLPRIPFASDFWAFSKAGRKLGEWHLNYETVEPWPLVEDKKGLELDPAGFYRVQKMVFGKKNGKPDKSVIIYNGNLTLRDIPPEAYDYVVNGKSAIEWIMERYAVTVDKASGIKNDPNDWSDDPRYIVGLLKRVVRVSVETVGIVGGLPALSEG
jgi:predicted helicase